MQTYTQCRLRLGQREQVAWIPSQFAKKNTFLKIKGENGWRVLDVGGTKSEDFIEKRAHNPLKLFPSLQKA